MKFIRLKPSNILLTQFIGTLQNEETMFADDYLQESGGANTLIAGFPASATWNAGNEIKDIADTSYIDSNGGWSEFKFIYDDVEGWSLNPDYVPQN